MSLFAIADPHLSFNTSKPMDVFAGWADYTARLEKNWRELVGPEDTVVIAGDISWGMDLREAAADFAFLDRLPGRKILMKGNHDYWWTTRKKMDAFLRERAGGRASACLDPSGQKNRARAGSLSPLSAGLRRPGL